MEAVIYNLPRSYEILKDVPGEQRNADLPLGNRLQWLDCGSPQNLVQAKNRMEELGKYSNTQKKPIKSRTRRRRGSMLQLVSYVDRRTASSQD